jgi:DNA-nicking Smr family endonuclease
VGRRNEDRGINRPFAGLGKLKAANHNDTPKSLGAKTAVKSTAGAPRRDEPSGVSDDELFLLEMAGTERLEQTNTRRRVGAPPLDPKRRAARVSDDAEVLAQLADLCGGDGPFEITDTDEYIEGIAEGIDRRLLKRLRAGEYAVQAHIDLHGATQKEARELVGRFLVESRRRGRRCVLIVHGRGNHSKDQIPVLKQAVKSWLERGQIGRMVLAFATARAADGGAGAVYVLLRR